MGYIVTLLTIICIYTILTAAMDLILGYAGLFSFVHAALCGIGSYTAAALMVKLGWGLVPAFGVALAALNRSPSQSFKVPDLTWLTPIKLNIKPRLQRTIHSVRCVHRTLPSSGSTPAKPSSAYSA